MLPIILIVIYIIGVILWMKIEKKYFPYKEGEYKIEFDGAHEVTPEIHDGDSICRSVLWPLCLAVIIALLPMRLLIIIFEKL